MNEKTFNVPTMWTLRKAGEATGLSYDFLRKLCLSNSVVYVKAGTKYLVNMEKLIEFLNSGDGEMIRQT